jgi:hypothetical protein
MLLSLPIASTKTTNCRFGELVYWPKIQHQINILLNWCSKSAILKGNRYRLSCILPFMDEKEN